MISLHGILVPASHPRAQKQDTKTCLFEMGDGCEVQCPSNAGPLVLFLNTSSWNGAAISSLVGLQSPATCATRAGGDSGSNFENYGLFHAKFPDTGRNVFRTRCVYAFS